MRNGSDGAVLWVKDNIHLIRTLNQFEYVDDDGRDHGKYIREKSKELVELVSNDSQLKQLRLETQEKRRSSRVQADPNRARPSRQSAARSDDNDAELQLALEVSMQSALEEEERRKQLSNDDDDLKKAIQLSKQEDSKHSANASVDLFGTPNNNHLSPQQPVFASNQVDLFSLPQEQEHYQQQTVLTSGHPTENDQKTHSTGNVVSIQPHQQQFGSPSQLVYSQQQQAPLFGNAPVQSHFTGSNNPFNQITTTSPPPTSSLPFTRTLDSPTRQQTLFDEHVPITTNSNNLLTSTTTAPVSQPFFLNSTNSAPTTSFYSTPSVSTQPSAFTNNLNSFFDHPSTTQTNNLFAQSPTTAAGPISQSSSLFDRPTTSHPFSQSATPAFAGSQSPFASPVPSSQALFNPPLPPKQAITNTGKDLFGTSTSNADYVNSTFNSITTSNYNYNGNVDVSIPISTNNTFQNTNSHNPFITPTSPKIPSTNAGYSNYVQAAPTGYGFGNVQQPAQQQQHEQKSHQPTQSLIDL